VQNQPLENIEPEGHRWADARLSKDPRTATKAFV